ncbi:ribonuclease P protein component 4 [Stetteria hydrogenophila]
MVILYRLAVDAVRAGEVGYARMLTSLIRRIAERSRVRPPRWVKRGICKNCGAPLIPGVTARVRLRSQGGMSYRVVVCSLCGWIHRYPYKIRGRAPRSRGGHEGERGEPEGGGEEGPPLEPRRDHREEWDHRGGYRGDQAEAQSQGRDQG